MSEKEIDVEQIKKDYKERLESDIKTLEAKKENLENQCHDLRVRLESERKFIEVERQRQFSEERKKYESLANNLDVLKSSLELKEIKLKERQEAVERAEKQFAMIDEQRRAVHEERNNFLVYKAKVELELKKAEAKILEANEAMKEVEARRDTAYGMERKMEEVKLDLDLERGRLEHERKEFEIYKQNEISKYTKEAVHV